MNYKNIILFAALAAAIPLAPLEAEDKISPDYTMEIEDQGRLEQFYRMNGPYEVKSQVISRNREEYGNYKYTLWYPADPRTTMSPSMNTWLPGGSWFWEAAIPRPAPVGPRNTASGRCSS